MQDKSRTAAEAVRKFFETFAPDAPSQAASRDLYETLADLFDDGTPNSPAGPRREVEWRHVPAHSFVLAPDRRWYEVVSTHEENGRQVVTLKSPDGKEGTFPRTPNAIVLMRSGSRNEALEEAIGALAEAFGGFAIISDGEQYGS